MNNASRAAVAGVATLIVLGVVLGLAAAPVAAQDSGSTTPITSCTTINSSGSYEVVADFNSSTNEGGDSCITITASDVTVDGNNSRIEDTVDLQHGVEVGSVSNVVVTDLRLYDFYHGVRLAGTNDSRIVGIAIDSAGTGPGSEDSGIVLISGGNNTVRDASIYTAGESGGAGIEIEKSHDNLLENNDIYAPYFYGVWLQGAHRNTIKGNEIEDDGIGTDSRAINNGIYVDETDVPGETPIPSNNNNIVDNELYGRTSFSSQYGAFGTNGIEIWAGEGTTIENNYIVGFQEKGIYAGDEGAAVLDNTIRNIGGEGVSIAEADANVSGNLIARTGQDDGYYGSGDGIRVNAANVSVIDNKVQSAHGNGLTVNDGPGLTARRNRLYDSGGWAVSLEQTTATLEAFDIASGADSLTASGHNFSLASTGTAPSSPQGRQDIGIYVNTSTTATDSSLELAIQYPDEAVASVNESTLSMWRYTGAWSELNGTNTVDVQGNTVTGVTNSSGLLAPLAANDPPTANISASPANVSVGESVTFDAAGSTDPDGDIVEYRWDFDGDGVVDETTNGDTPSTTTIYASGGAYNATVTVVDNGDDETTAATLVTVAAGTAAGEAWPQFGYDSQHTGSAPNNTATGDAVVERWTYNTGEGSDTFAIADGTVYLAKTSTSGRDYVHAVDAETGTTTWQYFPGGDRIESLAYHNGILYVGSDDTITAVYSTTGNEKWERETSWNTVDYDTGADELVVTDDRVYAALTDGGIESFHASNGSLALFTEYGDSEYRFQTPAVANGSLYVTGHDSGTDEAVIASVNATDGTTEWEHRESVNDSAAPGSPAVHNGTVYVGGPVSNNTFYAFDATTGNETWNRTFDEPFAPESAPAVVNETVYVVSGDHYEGGVNVTALDASNGQLGWTTQVASSHTRSNAWMGSTPAIVNDTVYVGSKNGNVYGLDAGDGAVGLNRSLTTPINAVDGMVAVVDGTVYAEAGDSTLHALAGRAPLGPQNFSVSLSVTNLPVSAGEPYRVNATVTNDGGYEGTQTIVLETDGTERDTATVTLDALESETVTLEWATSSGDAGTYATTVASDNDTAALNVTVDSASATSPRQFNYCTVLDEPGVYQLTADITDSRAETCLTVTASDVVLDGQGHTVKRSRFTDAVNVTSPGSISNVTVRNLSVDGGQDAFVVHTRANNATVAGLEFTDNAVSGATRGMTLSMDGANATVDATIANNRLLDVENGIDVDSDGDDANVSLAITDNQIDAESTGIGGIEADGDGEASDIAITGNTITTASTGIADVDADGSNQTVAVEMADNDITAALEAIDDIELDGDRSPTTLAIHNNTIDAEWAGIEDLELDGANRTVDLAVAGNDVSAGDEGIYDIDTDGTNQTVAVDISQNVIEAEDEGLTDVALDGENSSASLSVDNNSLETEYAGIDDIDASGANQSIDVAIADNIVTAGDEGIADIDLEGTNQSVEVAIAGNEITTGYEGIDSINAGGSQQSVGVTIENNAIDADEDGIYDIDAAGSNQSAEVTIQQNTVASEQAGITYTSIDGENGSVTFNVTDNSIQASDTAFDEILADGVDQTVGIRIADNEITAGDSGLYYVTLDGTNQTLDVAVTDNLIAADSFGIEQVDTAGLNQTGTVLIAGNNVTGFSEAGMYLDDHQVYDHNDVQLDIVANDVASGTTDTDGVRIDAATGSGPPTGRLLVASNNLTTTGATVALTGGPVEHIDIEGNVLAGSTYGVRNANTSRGYVNATGNYWTAADGPSSAGSLADPVTGRLANGSGSAVTERGNGTANVHFDPWLSTAPQANYSVTIDDTNAPVSEGERLTVNATLVNNGNGTERQQVRLLTGDVVHDSKMVSVPAAATESVSLAWVTTVGDAGDYSATVAIANASASTPVTVESKPSDTPTPTPTPTDTPTSTTTPTATATATDTATPTPTVTATQSPTDSSTATATQTEGDDEFVVGDGPGFGFAGAVLALLCVVVIARRRG